MGGVASRLVVATYASRTKEKAKGQRGDEGEAGKGGGTLLEINRNVTIFQRLFPYPRVFLRIFPLFTVARPDEPFTRFSLCFFVSLAPTRGEIYARENRPERGWLRAQDSGKKLGVRLRVGWRPLCTYKG